MSSSLEGRFAVVTPAGEAETPRSTRGPEHGPGDREALSDRALMRRFASPERIARVVGSLVSDEASHITAEVVTVVGGPIAWGCIGEPIGV